MQPTPADFDYTLDFKVRDYECDLQGIVNNSVYQNYLEHARHEFLLSKGVHFAQLAKQGINLIVTRIELDYKKPLRSGDTFCVALSVKPRGALRGYFEQAIFVGTTQQLAAKALVTWAAMDNQGKPLKIGDIAKQLMT